jgi:hypothetical protein
VQRWMNDAAGDEGSSRVMEDRAKWMEGERKQLRDQQARNFIMRPTNDI